MVSRCSCLVAFFLNLSVFPGLGLTQQVATFSSAEGRTFAYVRDKVVSVNGSGHGSVPLQTYAHAHPGHYLLFAQGSAWYVLEDPKSLQAVDTAYEPLISLEARQRELEAQQKPLEEEQRVLAAKQKAAAGNLEEVVRIAGEQGRIGQEQGTIGQRQGEIGEKQGAVSQAFYDKAVSLIDACLAQNICRRVAP